MTSANYYCYVYYDEQWQAYYVGKGQNKRAYKSHSVPFPSFVQIFNFTEEWQAFECEIELIAFWGRQLDGGCLLNKSTGGPGRPGATGEKHSPETIKKMSALKVGENNPFYGCKHTPETRKKIAEANSRRVITEETRAKLSASRKGKRLSSETKAKISAARKKKK